MNINYRPDIDGLRAIAVLSVIAFHLNQHWLHGGFIGVDIFFVISGYLITKIIYTDILNKEFSFKYFYQRRINRILPVFFVVMFCTAFAAWYLLLPNDFTLFMKSLKSTTYFWENMWFAYNTGGYWDSSATDMPILHTWSLAVEEQFYIALPFLLLFLFKLKFNCSKILVTLGLIAFISFLLAQLSPLSAFLTKYNYYSLITGRAGELLIGSIIGILSVKRSMENGEMIRDDKNHLTIKNSLTIIGFLMILLSIIFLSEKHLFPSFWAAIPTLGAALIIFCYDKNTYIAKFLSIKPIVFIGKISYSLYLWHWPIIVLSRKYLLVDNFTTINEYLVVILFITFLSLFSFYVVEKPCRKHNKTFKFSLIAYYIIPSAIIFMTYAFEGKINSSSYAKYEEAVEPYKLQTQYLNPENNFCNGIIMGDCVFGDKSKKPEILMIGDSHAGHYSPYLDEAGKKYEFAVKIINYHGCEFLPEQEDENKWAVLSQKEPCIKAMDDIKKEIDQYPIIIYALKYNLFPMGSEFLASKYLPQMVSKLKEQQVIVLAQVPTVSENERLKFMNAFLKGKHYQSNGFLTNGEKIANNLVKSELKGKAIFFDPLSYLDENAKKEWPIYHGLMAYAYDSHLNEYVTRKWSEEVLPKQKEFWESVLKQINNKAVN
ncbi:acyltransferase family protein [Pectobacterium brasiliense]|uniref:acyltransferase family protein n=1 Tax=Pectobacterium brasiliense TaxID=180957 RepID=UPI0032ED7170